MSSLTNHCTACKGRSSLFTWLLLRLVAAFSPQKRLVKSRGRLGPSFETNWDFLSHLEWAEWNPKAKNQPKINQISDLPLFVFTRKNRGGWRRQIELFSLHCKTNSNFFVSSVDVQIVEQSGARKLFLRYFLYHILYKFQQVFFFLYICTAQRARFNWGGKMRAGPTRSLRARFPYSRGGAIGRAHSANGPMGGKIGRKCQHTRFNGEHALGPTRQFQNGCQPAQRDQNSPKSPSSLQEYDSHSHLMALHWCESSARNSS